MSTTGRTPHVLLVHQLFVAGNEAGGTRHYELSRELVDRGGRVTVVTSPVSYLSGERKADVQAVLPAGIEVRRCTVLAAASRGFVGRVVGFLSFMVSSSWTGLRVREVDLVWGTTPPIFQAPTAWLLARLKRVPFVLEVRDLWPDFAVELGVLQNPVLIRIAKALERFLYRSADLIVVNSPGFVDHVVQEGANRDRIVLVANGVDADDFDPEDSGAQVRQELGLGDAFVVLYAGAHGIPNDLDVVLRAAREAEEEDGVFVFVGSGRDAPRIHALAEEWSLQNVVFAGPRAKDQMPAYLAAADVCVAILKPLPMFTTTFPNKVFDYMAAGRPVVLAIDGVVREVVDRAGAGTFVPPGDADALLDVVRSYRLDPARREREGRAGRAAVEAEFKRADQAAHLVEAFEGLLPESHRFQGAPSDR